MKTLFLISSCIRTRHGVYTAAARLNQTIETLKSIRDKVPDAKIIIFDCSAESELSEYELNELGKYNIGVIQFYKDPVVQQIYNDTDNHDIVKSYTEMYCTIKTLEILFQNPEVLKVDRIFKMSGRYTLTDDFSLDNFDHSGKYIFAKRRESQFPPHVTGNLDEQLMTRLWSWDASKSNLVLARYSVMLEDFCESLHKNQYRDIEHLIFKYMNGPCLIELEKVGVVGLLGPNGYKVTD